MSNPSVEIIELLNAHYPELIEESLSVSPFLLPYAKDETKSYVAVWIYFPGNQINLQAIHRIFTRVIEIFVSHFDLEQIIGVEIIPCLVDSNGLDKRLCRLSVFTSAMEYFTKMPLNEMLGVVFEKPGCVNPCPGIQCMWYIAPCLLS